MLDKHWMDCGVGLRGGARWDEVGRDLFICLCHARKPFASTEKAHDDDNADENKTNPKAGLFLRVSMTGQVT
jgi:hypothetical protein